MVTDLTHLGDVDLLDLLHPLDPGLGDDLLRLCAALLEGGDLGVLGDGGRVDGHLPHGGLLQVSLLPLGSLGFKTNYLKIGICMNIKSSKRIEISSYLFFVIVHLSS